MFWKSSYHLIAVTVLLASLLPYWVGKFIAPHNIILNENSNRPRLLSNGDKNGFIKDNGQQRRGWEVCHEALVHPLLLTHENPQRVAIFLTGGTTLGEPTLREVFKHKTVEECLVIGRGTAIIVQPPLCDTEDCLPAIPSDNATFHYTDATDWFIQRYLNNNDDEVDELDKFDVIILGQSDPIFPSEVSCFIKAGLNFTKALRAALREGGILGGHAGIEKQQISRNDGHDWITMVEHLKQAGFFSLKDYFESSCDLPDPWKFFVTHTESHGLTRWHASEAHVEVEIVQRTRQTKLGQHPFHSIDGATIANYHMPSRVSENHFCSYNDENLQSCNKHRLNPDKVNVPLTSFEVRQSTNPKAGRGVFATRDISAGSYIGSDDGVHASIFLSSTINLIASMTEKTSPFDVSPVFRPLAYYTEGYGVWFYYLGKPAVTVDPGILTFVNHGCNGTYNAVPWVSLTELTANEDEVPPELMREFYNPSRDRHYLNVLCANEETLRSIPAGAEILDNYLYGYPGMPLEHWRYDVQHARELCQSQLSSWSVAAYEELHGNKEASEFYGVQ